MALNFAATMSRLNDKLLTVFPDSIQCNGTTIACIAPPIEFLKKLAANNYETNATFTFQIRESDRAANNIAPMDGKQRPVISHTTTLRAVPLQFEVYSFKSDVNDSTVNLLCYYKQ